MFGSASQHLVTYSPSSTTISYTVSNALPGSTRTSRIVFVLSNVFRMLLCLFVLAVDITKLHFIFHFEHLLANITELQDTVTGQLALNIARAADWRFVAAGSFLVFYFCLRKGYTGGNMSLDPNSKLCAEPTQRRLF